MFRVLHRNINMVLIGVFFFYLGCGITLNFLSNDCVEASTQLTKPQSDSEIYSLVEYAVLILTSPDNEERRDAIRATWQTLASNLIEENGVRIHRWNASWIGQHMHPPYIKYLFTIGTQGLDAATVNKLKKENSRTHDLLLLDSFKDSYQNLAAKVLHSIEWINDNLKGIKYVIKCDDDSFVRIDSIVNILDTYAPEMNAPGMSKFITFKKEMPSYTGLYWGYFNGRGQVFLSGKWAEKDWFMCDYYLPYAVGGAYVISRSIVNFIGRNHNFLSQYSSEDVSMGVWTAALEGINRVHDIRFDTEWKSRGCVDKMLVRHKQSSKDMFDMYRTLVRSKGENLCEVEEIFRKFYKYNWSVLPTQCCGRKL